MFEETITSHLWVRWWADAEGMHCGPAPDPIARKAGQRACPRCGRAPMRSEGYYEAHVCVAWIVYCPACGAAIDHVSAD